MEKEKPSGGGLGDEKRGGHTQGSKGETGPEKLPQLSGVSLATGPAEPGRHLKLLSLDGSYGDRALSVLLILKQVFGALELGRDVKPCDYFDLIGGSGTGGILAIMLGRLRMSIPECIEAYRSLSDRTFRPRKQWTLPSIVSDLFPSRFDSDALIQAAEDVVRRAGEPHGAKLIDRRDSQCKVFVTAATQRAAGLQMHLLRTYRSAGEFQPDISIGQAFHAALAASELVGPCSIAAAGFSYTDGLSSWNNPSVQVLAEGEQTWAGAQAHSTSLLSLGAGIPRNDVLKSLSRPLARSISEWSTEADVTAGKFEREHPGLVSSGGLARLSLTEFPLRLGSTIEGLTETYLCRPDTVAAVHAFVHRLRNPLPLSSIGPPLDPGPEPVGESGPSQLQEPMSPPYVEHDEELVPYSAITGETSEKPYSAIPSEKSEKSYYATTGEKSEKQVVIDTSEKSEKKAPEKSQKAEEPLSPRSVQWLIVRKDKFTEQPSSLFFLAAKESRIGLIKGLLKKGVDINRQDQLGKTAVHLAAEEGLVSVLQTLIACGADINFQDAHGETALVKAARKDDKMVALQLLDGGADPDVADDIGWTPLAWASFNGHEALVKVLAPRTALGRDPSGMGSPLWRARKLGMEVIVRILEAEIAKRSEKPVKPPTPISLTPSPLELFVGIPSSFAVVMTINSCTIRAVVASGCQSSVMSARWLAPAGLDMLLDKRYSGVVRGLSIVPMIGRVHLFDFILEGVSYSTSVSVLDSPDCDFLLGLDFLKRYKGSIDFSDNTLRLEGGSRQKDGDKVHGKDSKAMVNVVPMYGIDTVRNKGKGRA
ncbi:uncharacterized protein DNG_04329 [Cephalotrichum gorgonifer]|uniref:phospholipase A2 n=1 Tax=Cephalotrichum gorgonifer TaxID=2041049 RepID=A0AAE8MVW4_9PEZI|nr:uncharacterized protein DNG_04329 [Cephalotrichum gorgonifer]